MFSFLTIYPEWITRQCEIKENTTQKTPIIKLNQVSYDLLYQNETVILKHEMKPYVIRGYREIIDDSLDTGVCDIITE